MSDAGRRAHELADRLDAAAGALLAEVATLPPALISWKPAPDVWSVMEILCHVEEFVPYWTAQAQQIVARPEEPWGRDHTDRGRLEAVAHAGARTLSDVVSAIHTSAGACAAVLRAMPDTALDIEAQSRNPRWGRKPAAFVVDHLLIQHVEKHLGQVRRNVMQAHGRGQIER